jgi:hypothetical protein
LLTAEVTKQLALKITEAVIKAAMVVHPKLETESEDRGDILPA